MKTKLLSLLLIGFIGILCSNYSFSQGADTPGGALGSPISIPFNANGTTVGVNNNLDSSAFYPTTDPPSNSGNDWFYSFCPATTGTIYITLTYNGSAVPQIFPSLQVFYGTPFANSTTFYTNNFLAGSASAVIDPSNNANTIGIPVSVQAGVCYYIMIDSYAYNTMGFAYNLQATYTTTTTTPPLQPGCTNMGFDNGTTSGWVGNWGHSIVNGGTGAPTPTYTPIYSTLNQGHHNVTTAGVDPFTGIIQKVCPLIPGNSNSLRLGDGPNASYGGAQIMQKFSVTAANALFTYYYAAVMQDAGSDHQNYEQPFFKIEALDCSGNPITCGNYLVTGGPGIPGFIQAGAGSSVYYKNWTPVLFDLTPYIGTCITIKFTVGDCSKGAHFAYAYLDATCGPLQIATPPAVCQFTNTSLTAPSGAASYSWVNTASPGTVLSTSNPGVVTPTTTGTVTYQCTMTSVTGCNSVVTTTVTVNPTPQISITNPPAVCAPNTVDITSASVVTISSGTGTISYYSDAACTVPIASPGAITTSGTYYIKILNGNGCYDVKPVTVVVNPTPTVNVSTADQTICAGQSVNLSSTITPAGVTTPVTFTNTADYSIPDGLAGGGNGPSVSSPIVVSGINPQTVGVLPIVSVNFSINHTYDADIQAYLQCPGGTTIQLSTGNGGAGVNYTNTTFVPTGSPSVVTGTAPFTGSFTPEQLFSLLNACAVNGTWNLVVYDNFQSDIGTILDWSITFNNFTPATFVWSPTTNMTNSTTLSPTVTPTVTTTYTLTGTSGVGGCSASDPITITVNPLPTATITGTTTVCQNAAAPNITFTGSNGTAPYVFTYNINGGANQTVSSGAGSTATVSAPTATVGAFTYNLVSVTSSGCPNPQTGSAIVTVNPLPTATIAGTTTVCQNAAAPNITFTGANGTAPYTFTYNINGGANQTVSSGAGSTITVSAPTATAGTFTYNLVSVSSANSCSQAQTGSAVVTVTPLPTATIAGTATVCQNAASPFITFTGANGTAPYVFTYNINGGANQTVSSGAGSTATVSAPTATVGVFTYTLVSVTSTGCPNPQTGSATVAVNPLPSATISGTTTVCQNAAAPNITFTGSIGTAPYIFTYNINGGANQTVSSGAGSTATVSAPTATAGTFTYNLISVVSANSCTQVQTGSAVVTVTALPTATISGTTTVCQNATAPTITFTGANGTAPYTFTYNINGGANQTVSSGAGTTATVTAPTATAGTFTYNLVSVSSATGCSQTQTGSAIVTVNLLPTATISGTTTVCQNAAAPNITFTGANGVAPYVFTYNINGGASQTVSSGAGSTATVSAPTATAGTFTYTLVSVSNASGCSQTQTGNAIVTVNPMPTATISGTATVCQNDAAPTITFTGANGTAPYTFTYNINGGANQTVSSGAGTTATVTAPTATAGTFTYNLVSVSNASGCSQTQTGSAIVTVNLLPTATISGTVTVCQNATAPTITFTGANGVAPYVFTYNINGGANQTVSSGAGSTATVSAPTATAGTFTYTLVSVSNASGCSQTQTGNAIVTVNPMPTATISGTATVCQNDAAPTITFTGANGTAPYTFTYNINGGANQTVSSGAGTTATVTAPTATAGTFTYNLVSVSNATGCSQTQTGSAIVTVNLLPTATISGTTTVCQNATAPTITFTGANGVAPYVFTYNINGGANQTVSSGAGSTATVSAPTATAGTFTYTLVSVSNASGCSQTQTGSAVVTVNSLPTATISGTTTVCQNSTSPTITFTGANGVAPYTFTYTINGGANQTASSGAGTTATVTASTATAGTFTYNLLSVSSATGCSQTQTGSAIVTVNPQPTATISGTVSVCQNTGNQTVTFTGANGTAPYTFTYSLNGGANQTISSGAGSTATVTVSSATAGTFTYALISVSESLGCSQTQSGTAIVTIDPAPTATISGTTSLCQGSAAPDVTLTGANGTAPYTFTYTLNGGANQTIVSNASGVATISVATGTAGTFSYDLVNVTSAIGCSQAQTGNATVTVLPTPQGTISGTTDVCQNDPSPVVTFTGSNDAPSYTFTYTLNGGANQTISSGAASSTATINAPTATAGTFAYHLIAVQGNNACTQTLDQTATIVINPTPTATISGTTTICDGSSASLTVNGTPNATVTYTDGTTVGNIVLNASGTGTINTGALTGTTTYTLQSVQSAAPASCSATLTSSVTVTVNPIPVADPASDLTACVGATVNVPAFNSTPAGATFGWTNSTPSIGLGANGIGNIASFTGTNPGTVPLSGTVTYAPTLNGCIGQAQTFTITIYPLPVADAGTNASGCQNTGLIPIGGPTDPNNTYSWSPTTGLTSGVSSNPSSYTINPGTTNYVLTVTSTQGCVNTDNVSVTIFTTPQVSIAPSTLSGCSPVSVTFTANAPTSVNCVWNIDGVGTVNGCGSVTESFTTPGQYGASIIVTDANGCTNTAVTAAQVIVFPDAVASFGVDAISHSTLDPTFRFSNASINATNYQWEFGDGVSSNEFEPVHTYDYEEAVYNVMLVASNEYGCIDTAVLTISVTPELIFYVPNAFTPDGDENNNTFFPVFTEGFDLTTYTMLIFDRWGEIIFETHDVDFGWDGTYHDMMCKDGVYTWKILIKEHSVDKHHEYHGHVSLLK